MIAATPTAADGMACAALILALVALAGVAALAVLYDRDHERVRELQAWRWRCGLDERPAGAAGKVPPGLPCGPCEGNGDIYRDGK